MKNLAGKSILQHSYEAAKKVSLFDDVVIAIDSEETAVVIESFGGKYIFTSEDCLSGTDRLVEVMRSKKFDADIWVNWQADEPFLQESDISNLLKDLLNKLVFLPCP